MQAKIVKKPVVIAKIVLDNLFNVKAVKTGRINYDDVSDETLRYIWKHIELDQ